MANAVLRLSRLGLSRCLPRRAVSGRVLASTFSVHDEVRRFDPSVPIEKAITPPATWYTRPEFHDLDSAAVFRQNWVAVGLAEKVKSPGDYIAGFLADEPYLVTRTADNTLAAYFNVCRHHATLLVDSPSAGAGADSFKCPYHGWTYGLDGRLTQARRLRGIQDFSARDYCLKPLAGVEQWGPLLFIQVAGAPRGLADWLKPLYDRLETLGFSNKLRFVRHREYSIACNWKVFVDNYLDGGYHVEYAHRDLASLLDTKSYKIESYGGFSIQSAAGNPDEKEGSARIGRESIYAFIFPNLMINRYGPWLDFNYCYPVDANNCVVAFDWLLDDDVIGGMSEEELAEYTRKDLAASDQVQQEDIWLCERVQRGLKSSSFEWGRYAPRVEHADYDFHCQLSDIYRKA